mmetsp:Transcript_12618/g.24277  ORF Transcript_12618/g.24277 Transcript_12618/m.24277 type:complete len:84 (-) Transcript_12618:291-542(-)
MSIIWKCGNHNCNNKRLASEAFCHLHIPTKKGSPLKHNAVLTSLDTASSSSSSSRKRLSGFTEEGATSGKPAPVARASPNRSC